MFGTREYSNGEILADGIVHGVALFASIAAASAVLTIASQTLETHVVAALSIYSATLIAMFGCSAAYNIIQHQHLKPSLRRLDQAAIFLKIAGTYTPVTILIGSLFSHLILAMIWITALGGVGLKLIGRMYRDRYSIPLYLGLGWASLLLMWPLAQTLPAIDVALILAGGILYSAGLWFHTWDELRFQSAIWHGFVFAAAACHFTAVTHASFALAA